MKDNLSTTMTTNDQVSKSVTRPPYSVENVSVEQQADKHKRDVIHTTPGLTSDGKPFDHVVMKKVANGDYRLQTIPPDVTGTLRPLEVYRTTRTKNNIINHGTRGTADAHDGFGTVLWICLGQPVGWL